MIEEDGKEREADMGNQGEGGALGRGVRKRVQAQSVCSVFIPTILGSNLVSVCGPHLTFCLFLWSDGAP